MWILFTPREVELIMRPAGGTGQNAEVLRAVQKEINPITGDAELRASLLERVKGAARNWNGGYEQQMKAILAAAERYR